MEFLFYAGFLILGFALGTLQKIKGFNDVYRQHLKKSMEEAYALGFYQGQDSGSSDPKDDKPKSIPMGFDISMTNNANQKGRNNDN